MSVQGVDEKEKVHRPVVTGKTLTSHPRARAGERARDALIVEDARDGVKMMHAAHARKKRQIVRREDGERRAADVHEFKTG
jgi:hypothetical protein